MPVTLIPYGLLANGNYGTSTSTATGQSQAAVIEVLTGLPSPTDAANFIGRTVYNSTLNQVYTWSPNPTPAWTPIAGNLVTVGAVNGSPPTSPTPPTGALYFDTSTEGLFCFDGLTWRVAGGQFAGQIIQFTGTGDGSTTSLPVGLATPTQTADVEVFLDGVRQNPGTDFNVVGSNVVMTTAPAASVKIIVRALVVVAVAQSAMITQQTATGNGTTQSFTTGQAGVNPNSIFVFVNGVLKTFGTDYTVVQDNTQISSIAHTASATFATVTTVSSAHGHLPGDAISIAGTNSVYANIATTVLGVPNPNQFTFTINASAPAPSIVAAPTQIMYFQPAAHLDIVTFSVAPPNLSSIVIIVLRNVVAAPSVGEANVGFNLGTPGTTIQGLYASKSGVTLQFKSLRAASGISFDTSDPNTLGISSISGMSFHIRATVIGSGGIWDITGNAPTATLVAIENAAVGWTIQLPTPTVPLNGRRIVIKDESGVAAGTNITITVSGGGALIEGSSSIAISTNYGGYTFYCDGAHWFREL
jgi:hypothetical protein